MPPHTLTSNSPSLHKMDYNHHHHHHRNSASARPGFSIGNILGDPFALATVGIALCGWLIAFVSSVIVDIQGAYPNYSWWCLAYMFCTILGVAVAVGMDVVPTYHVAIVGFLSAGLVFTTSSVNSLIYYAATRQRGRAAGFILLSMVSILWIFYYGSQPSASHRQAMDSFALHKDHGTSRTSRHMTQSYLRPETTHSSNHPAPQMYNSAQLAGFETASPVTGYPGGMAGAKGRPDSTPAFPQPGAASQQNLSVPQHQQQHQQQSMQAQNQQDTGVGAPTEYPYRAKAIYSYEANPDDANEISFSKHEILEVSDVSGRWWQAKKENGETGIAPSNYLILL
ncbi:High osmolarity signaling protein SHO1A [Teratosphaeria destructans]|uniref:High osmolarity signaling protein SHO1A n=1 Tax=Teratosphaeria destructans TaxID=418781 RepID=A0A9W7SYB4_9PEZI|nr:High osmolarity signaling protein SHO1A [Teratosphaeria destructans]